MSNANGMYIFFGDAENSIKGDTSDKISMLENDIYKEYRTDSDSISPDEKLFDVL